MQRRLLTLVDYQKSLSCAGHSQYVRHYIVAAGKDRQVQRCVALLILQSKSIGVKLSAFQSITLFDSGATSTASSVTSFNLANSDL